MHVFIPSLYGYNNSGALRIVRRTFRFRSTWFQFAAHKTGEMPDAFVRAIQNTLFLNMHHQIKQELTGNLYENSTGPENTEADETPSLLAPLPVSEYYYDVSPRCLYETLKENFHSRKRGIPWKNSA